MFFGQCLIVAAISNALLLQSLQQMAEAVIIK
jgi:hypothetical protein